MLLVWSVLEAPAIVEWWIVFVKDQQRRHHARGGVRTPGSRPDLVAQRHGVRRRAALAGMRAAFSPPRGERGGAAGKEEASRGAAGMEE